MATLLLKNISIKKSSIEIGNVPFHIPFIIMLIINVVLLLFMISDTSIYIKEARGFFENATFPYKIANLGVSLCMYLTGNPLLNDYGLRIPFVLIHIANCILMYAISLRFFTHKKDALLCVGIFMLIPGISVGALIVSNIGIIIFLSLSLIYYQMRYNRILYVNVILASILDSGGAVLCLALFFYTLIHRNHKTLIFSIIFFGVNMYIFTPIHGVPRAYFIDTIGLLAIIFTPAFFIYYTATLYISTIRDRVILLNLIPFIGIIFSLLLSVRQQVLLESFLPPISVGVPILLRRILFDIRTRLPQFRFKYYLRFSVIIALLLFGNLVLYGNKLTYLFDKNRNFAFSFYGAKDIAKTLQDRGITNIRIPNKELALRLRFYGINDGDKYKLLEIGNGDIEVRMLNRKVASYRVF